LKTTYTSALSSSNVAGVVSSVSGSTSLTWVSQKALAVALRTGTHVVSVSVAGGHVLVDVDGVRVLDTVVTLPPNVLVGFTGATGSKTDQHAVRNVTITPGGGVAPPAGSPLVAVPASVDFGDVTVAGSSTQNLVLKNTSATATTVTAVSAPSAPFSATLPAAGASVAAGGSVTVPVRFAPTVEITSTGTLSVTTSGGTVTVPITGTGVALPPPPPPPPPPPGGTALPVPGVGVWSFNGAAVMSGSDLVLNPVATSSRGSSFYPSAVPSEGLRATFTAVIGGGTGADGLTLALVDASKAGSTSLGASGGGLGLAGVPGFGVALKTTYTSALSSSNVAGVVSSVSGSTSLTWVSQKALAVALRTGTHVVSVSVTGGHVLVDVDGVRVLDTVVTLPPNVLVGFTGATGAKTDQHAVRNVTITRA